MTATATTAGKASGFGYLRGSLRIDDFDPAVSESYGYLALPLPADTTTGRSFEPLVTTSIPATGEQAPILGVYRDNGREELVSTFVYNGDQEHFLTLAHGMVTWLTRGIHLGHYRQYFSVHIDDVLLPNDRWSTEADCTAGADCNPNRDPAVAPYNEPIRMTGADAAYLESWQRARGFKLDLAYNAQGSAEAIAQKGRDELTDALLARKAEFRWINHTYGHEYLGCVKDYSVRPWRCTTDPVSGAIVYVGKAKIKNEITRDVSWATTRGIPVDKAELVTGEHSGLRALPQMQQDNPNFGPALTETGVTTTASDASREPLPRAVGAARTLPRYPMNIFYNVGTAAEEVDEYNWIYTSRANGGSGLCEDNPATSTCIEPLDPATAFRSHIVPLETRIAMRHVLSVDPRPHYAHQSNLAEERILYPVVDEVLAEQRVTFAANTPVVNPRMREAAVALDNQQAWAANKTKVTAYVSNGVVSVVNNTGAQLVPITLPSGSLNASGTAFGSAYAGERSSWVKIWQSSTETFRLPAGGLTSAMRVTLVNEGTYPYVRGGVSVWCDQLVRALGDVDVDLLTLTSSGREQASWELPANVRSLRSVPLWGEVPAGRAPRGPVRRAVIEAYGGLASAITSADGAGADACFASALRRLVEPARAGHLPHVLRSDDAVLTLAKMWRRGRDPRRMPALSLHEALAATVLLEHSLRPLAVRLEPMDLTHAVANGLAALVGIVAKWEHGTPMLMSEHGVYLRERYLSYRDAPLGPGTRAVLLAFHRRLSTLGYARRRSWRRSASSTAAGRSAAAPSPPTS